MFDLIKRLFGDKAPKSGDAGSGRQAKERLKILLVHDRSAISPDIVPVLRDEIIAVISKYMEIDQQLMDVSLTNSDGSVALVANIPVLKWKRGMGNKYETAGESSL